MVSLNQIGILIGIAVYIPYLIYMLFGRKIRREEKHKQVRIIEFICRCGILCFGILNFYGYGYTFMNQGLKIAWIIFFCLCLSVHYFCWLRYYIVGRREAYLYKRMAGIPYLLGMSECLLYLGSGILLGNPFVAVFSLPYGISHIYLGIRR